MLGKALLVAGALGLGAGVTKVADKLAEGARDIGGSLEVATENAIKASASFKPDVLSHKALVDKFSALQQAMFDLQGKFSGYEQLGGVVDLTKNRVLAWMACVRGTATAEIWLNGELAADASISPHYHETDLAIWQQTWSGTWLSTKNAVGDDLGKILDRMNHTFRAS